MPLSLTHAIRPPAQFFQLASMCALFLAAKIQEARPVKMVSAKGTLRCILGSRSSIFVALLDSMALTPDIASSQFTRLARWKIIDGAAACIFP